MMFAYKNGCQIKTNCTPSNTLDVTFILSQHLGLFFGHSLTDRVANGKYQLTVKCAATFPFRLSSGAFRFCHGHPFSVGPVAPHIVIGTLAVVKSLMKAPQLHTFVRARLIPNPHPRQINITNIQMPKTCSNTFAPESGAGKTNGKSGGTRVTLNR